MAERHDAALTVRPDGLPAAAEWTRLQALFDRLADLSEAEQSTALAEVEADDPRLARAMRGLLEKDRAGAGWIERTVTQAAQAFAAADRALIGRRIGPYRVVREIGHGGMGVVFEAEREDVFRKRVALKVATGAAYTPHLARRFDEERQILARLEHPGIARLLDGGTTDDGLPYLVMEYVDGLPIAVAVVERRAPLAERLGLFLQVCEAVQYAHECLVIHRDLKPANILVTTTGQVRLLDFGIATLLSPGDGRGGQTDTTLATLDYCSPEQLRGGVVTTRTDVYALGLVLYELLTGERGQRADTSSRLALEQSVCETPLPAPSVTAAARGDGGAARRLRGDLDTIVAVATEKDAPRRYASATALADDVRRHLAHEPIRATTAGRWYRTARFVRRRWRSMGVAAAVLAIVATGVVLVVRQARQTERRFQQVRQLANTLVTDVHESIRDLPGSTAAQAIVVQTAVAYLDGLATESTSDRALQLEIADGYRRVARLAYSLSRPSLSRPEDAATYYGKADSIVAALEQQAPDIPAVMVARVRLDTARGQFLDERGQQAEALAMLDGAVAVAERAVSIAPADRGSLDALAEALAELLSSFEDSPTAQARLTRYIEIEERRAASGSPTASTLNDLGMAYVQAGKLASAASDDTNAGLHYRRGIEQYERALRLEPANATVRRDLMLVWNHLSEVALGDRGTSSYLGSGARFSPLPPEDQAAAEEAARETIEHATWLYERDPGNPSVAMDFAIAVGRSAPAFPIGDVEAVRLLDRSLDALRSLGPEHAGGTAYFLIEFLGSRAERHRQRGEIALAIRDWSAVRRELDTQRHSDSSTYRPQRMVLPMFVNWATTLAEQGDHRGARALAEEIVRLAATVAAREDVYARAPGWPPRVQGWLATLYDRLRDGESAQRARDESRRLWAVVAGRTGVPQDLIDEARRSLGDSGR
jgi:eukaryotic-like serine/threonine-protein kinase